MKLNANCCDGIYNSLDIHFTSICDNKCEHCIDTRFNGLGVKKPDIPSIIKTIIENSEGVDDILFLGGEPCIYLKELLDCVRRIKNVTDLKVFVTTAIPKICFDEREMFLELLDLADGVNLSVQHNDEFVADRIRCTTSKYDRQRFYQSLPNKEKIRINLNIVKPFLYTKENIEACLRHYDQMGFSSIKLSEIQHGEDVYVSFASVFGLKMHSAYSDGCQTYLDTDKILPGFKTPLLLKRSCFLCEESLPASLADGFKLATKLFRKPKNKYGVIYGNGSLQKGWI